MTPRRSANARISALALLLSITLGAASAEAAATRKKPAAHHPPPGTCSAGQRAVIDEAFAEARLRVREAIAFIEARPQDPHVRRWFGATRPKLVQLHLELLAEALAAPHRFTLRCGDRPACGAWTFAYAVRSRATLGFCARFFAAGAQGQDARFGVVVHELSHLVLNTRDAAYAPARAEALARKEPEVAATNADNYEYFVELLPRPGRAGAQ